MAGWVCPVCGFDQDSVKPLDAINAIRSFPRRYRSALAALSRDDAFDALIRRRPEPGAWSALEYTAHAADMIDRFAPAIRRIQVEDRPTLPFFDPQARVDDDKFNDRTVSRVLSDLETACADMAATLETVEAEDWTRTGHFDWGDRDILDAARNAVHEGSHHLRDTERTLAEVTRR
ncbi:MAG TPA: DinB family protein [Acidimicrobiales bacterium]|nr:DinB family protein [Acidimicrobiales bacterium]